MDVCYVVVSSQVKISILQKSLLRHRVFINKENNREVETFHPALKLIKTGSKQMKIAPGTLKLIRFRGAFKHIQQ